MARTPLAYLFETALPEPKVPKPAVEDISLRHEPIGLGFPGERFDLMCPQCGATMRLRRTKFGSLFYGCQSYPECDAGHGAHKDGSPQGVPGDKATRRARTCAHKVFDRLWDAKDGQKPIMSRHAAYAWLRKEMKLSEEKAHISHFNEAQCEQLQALVKKKYPGVKNAWDMIAGDDELF